MSSFLTLVTLGKSLFRVPKTTALLYVIGPALRRLRQGDENLEETLTLEKNKNHNIYSIFPFKPFSFMSKFFQISIG